MPQGGKRSLSSGYVKWLVNESLLLFRGVATVGLDVVAIALVRVATKERLFLL